MTSPAQGNRVFRERPLICERPPSRTRLRTRVKRRMASKPRAVFTPGIDFVAFGVPLLLGIAFVPSRYFILPDHVPGWAWLFLVVAVDVAHVWATVFRTYLDKRELFRRPRLYIGAPMGCFFTSFFIYYLGSSSLFWTAISYVAIYHFVKQDLGLLFLYIARNNGRVTKQQIDLEKLTLYTGAVCPVLLWHASPPDAFHWFRANERFAFQLPAMLVLPVQAYWVSVFLVYVYAEVSRWRAGTPLNLGKLYVMGASWLTWSVGTLCDHEVTALIPLPIIATSLAYHSLGRYTGHDACHAQSLPRRSILRHDLPVLQAPMGVTGASGLRRSPNSATDAPLVRLRHGALLDRARRGDSVGCPVRAP